MVVSWFDSCQPCGLLLNVSTPYDGIGVGWRWLAITCDRTHKPLYSLHSLGRDYDIYAGITGILVTKQQLDRESVSVHHLSVIARDGGGLECRMSVDVHLTDVNDNPPRFVPRPHYAASLLEDASVGTPVLRVAAVDPDLGVNRRVRYSMEPPHVGVLFSIDAVSGVVTLLQSLDREQQDLYNLTVSASDQVSLSLLLVEAGYYTVCPLLRLYQFSPISS